MVMMMMIIMMMMMMYRVESVWLVLVAEANLAPPRLFSCIIIFIMKYTFHYSLAIDKKYLVDFLL